MARVNHGLTINPIIIDARRIKVKYANSLRIGIFFMEIVGTRLAKKTARVET